MAEQKVQKAKKYKCSVCGRMVDTTVTISGKRYCDICKAAPLKNAEDYKKLCTYLYENLGAKDFCNMGLLTKNLKTLRDKYSFTDSITYYTLRYMYEFEEDNPPPPFSKESDVFGVVFYYYKAKQFWQQFKELRVQKNKIEEALSLPQKVVTINRSELIKQEELDYARRKLESNREELSVDDIEDDGVLNKDFYDVYYQSRDKGSNKQESWHPDLLEISLEDFDIEEG